MQKLILACGINPIGALIELVFWIIGFGLAIIMIVVVKAWVFPRSQWVNRRAPMLKSFLMFMTGTIVTILVMAGLYFLAPTLISYRLGFLRPYHIILLLAICIHDAFVLNYWLKQGVAQTISLDASQQLQVDPAHTNWYQPIVVAFGINLLLVLFVLPVLALTD